MFTIIKPGTKIDFIAKKNIFIFISLLLIVISTFLVFTRGINYGIDFTGGVELQVRFNKDVDIQNLRLAMSSVKGSDDLQVQSFGDKDNEFLVRLQGGEKNLEKLSSDITDQFNKTYGINSFDILKIDIVGPKVGKELRNSGIYAVLYALIGILIYITLRFDFKYSPGAVIALMHDVIITVGIFSLLQIQFTLSTIAALLTIVGYSLNDTVVVFDRIRETTGKNKGVIAVSLINKALNETLSRTLLTSFTTLLVVICLFLFGGPVIMNFALALLIGIFVGTYSSIFIATPSLIFFDKLREKKKNQ